MSRWLNESYQASPEARHMEKVATDTFDFALIRRGGLTYVDKTALIHPIANGSMGNQFFLARPRRLTACSGATLEEVEQGISAALACQSERLGVPLRGRSGPSAHLLPNGRRFDDADGDRWSPQASSSGPRSRGLVLA